MSVFLPIPEPPASRQQIILDDVPYNLLLTWNERAGAWVMGLEDRDGAPIIVGRRVVLNLDLIGGYQHLDIPDGAIFAVNPSGNLQAVGREDLIDGRVLLVYVPREEVEELGAL